jgi:hypothetical protein
VERRERAAHALGEREALRAEQARLDRHARDRPRPQGADRRVEAAGLGDREREPPGAYASQSASASRCMSATAGATRTFANQVSRPSRTRIVHRWRGR